MSIRRTAGSVLLLALLAYVATGVYEVQPEETGVAFVLGRMSNPNVPPGIHWNFPAPIGNETVLPTRLSQVLEIGYPKDRLRAANLSRRQDFWFTAGTSVVECRLNIQYSIARLDQYLLSHQDPDAFMRLTAERAVTRFFADRHVDDVLTTGRQALVGDVSRVLQAALDSNATGVVVQDVSIAHLAPPLPGNVSDAFRQVQSARSERERDIEQARAEAARIVFSAEAEAEGIRNRASGEKFARVQQAQAAAQRFRALAAERAKAPGVTETRLYRDIVPDALNRATLYVVPGESANVTVE